MDISRIYHGKIVFIARIRKRTIRSFALADQTISLRRISQMEMTKKRTVTTAIQTRL